MGQVYLLLSDRLPSFDLREGEGNLKTPSKTWKGTEDNLELVDMPTRYDASMNENKWYERWEKAGLFAPVADETLPTYTITIPPPNITGSLHMGHALVYSFQDLLGRYHRLLGERVLILPGQDHAGIATQSVVDKQLRKEGTSAAKLGREEFVKRVWQWRKESGDTILHQFRLLGCAFDWSRLQFTLDPQYADTVLRVFIDWFDRGLIFRGKRVVNWDPKLKTSVSDIETVRETRKGKLYHVRYPFADGSGEIVIATTRPETMLGDVAVAVHPSDERYRGKTGKQLRLPLSDRLIPLIEDIYPDPAFGTGAVKITPAHDANDFLVGVRNDLDQLVILDEEARISLHGPYHGLDRNEARRQIVQDLEEGGFLIKVEDHEIPIVISDRSGEIIEPLLSEQWFCDQPKLAKRVIQATLDDEVVFFPPRYEAIFLDWLENIREWCISRQLWWGHRIPVYYTETNRPIAAMTWEDAQEKAGAEKIVRQDDDVLDTWFSSGLWPFATLGWPEATSDFQEFFPTQVLVTDRNIINLWVARMLMMSYDLVGTAPFAHVAIHATVMREDGRRMSKSLGTGIDPVQLIQSIGADALRWTLLSQSGQNQEIRFSERKTEEARNFANKIWNATRFVLLNIDPATKIKVGAPPETAKLELIDVWLLSRLVRTEEIVRAALATYDMQEACQALHRFFWANVCDWYLETCKPRLQNEQTRSTPQWVLIQCFDAFLKMLHPVMPHLTEELYSYLPIKDRSEFLMSASWPKLSPEYLNPEAEGIVERAFEVTVAFRALRASLDVSAMKPLPVAYYEGDLQGCESIVASQAWFGELKPGRPDGQKHLSSVAAGVEIYLPLAGAVDSAKLLLDLDRDERKALDEKAQSESRLANSSFLERAKPEAVEKERQKLIDLAARLESIRQRRELFI
jgi:valyl-tRNA synthetase